MKLKVGTDKIIYEVQARPWLWDRNNELYKSKEARADAWLDITTRLCPYYDNLCDAEQKELVKKIQQRWRTARDMYKKTKLSESQTLDDDGSVKKEKTYVYSGIMTFLDGVPCKMEEVPVSVTYEESPEEYVAMEIVPAVPEPSPPVKKRKTQFESVLLECIKSNQQDQLESEDLSFFQSLQPTLKKFNTLQKMMFRTRVLQIIMDMETATTHNITETNIEIKQERGDDSYSN